MNIGLIQRGLDKMETNHNQLFTKMMPALISKKNEFHLYGYTSVKEEEIWVYCLRKVWRNKDVNSLRVHEIVNGILGILPAAFMTHTHIEEQRNVDWFSDLNNDELQILLSPAKNNEEKDTTI